MTVLVYNQEVFQKLISYEMPEPALQNRKTDFNWLVTFNWLELIITNWLFTFSFISTHEISFQLYVDVINS